MKNYLVYTLVTAWNEPPRARHQVAYEFAKDGVVYFIERSVTGSRGISIKKMPDNVIVITPSYPINYKMRYRVKAINENYHKWLLSEIKLWNIDFEMVINFDYTATAINRYFDNVIFYSADDNVGFGKFNPGFINRYHKQAEQQVAEGAKICIATSEYMKHKISAFNKYTYLVPLGAPVIRNLKLPEIKNQDKLPVLAIAGYLDSNLDHNLLEKLLAEFKIIFIGPVNKKNSARLKQYPNAVFAGIKTGDALYECILQADVCIAPYDISKINKGATPNKLWLYLALGMPSVITSMPNIENWVFEDKLVYICNNNVFVEKCIEAHQGNNKNIVRSRVKMAEENTWYQRVKLVKEIFYGTPVKNEKMDVNGNQKSPEALLAEKVSLVKSFEEVVTNLDRINNGKSPGILSFINAHAFNLSFADKHFYNALMQSDILVRDGKGMEMMFNALKINPGKNLCGTDFIPYLLGHNKNKTIALFGTDDACLEKASAALSKQGHNIVARANGFYNESYYEDLVQRTKPEIILLGMGMPKQEKLSLRLKNNLGYPCLIINGGAIIDHYGHKVKRAPGWIRNMGAEWVFRLATEPRRLFKRYVIGNILFLKRVQYLKQQLKAF
jgi:exopolysaccharide biosynthesis WecB/TagA/CpsF family protein